MAKMKANRAILGCSNSSETEPLPNRATELVQLNVNMPTVRSDDFSRSTAKAVTTSPVGLLKPQCTRDQYRANGRGRR